MNDIDEAIAALSQAFDANSEPAGRKAALALLRHFLIEQGRTRVAIEKLCVVLAGVSDHVAVLADHVEGVG